MKQFNVLAGLNKMHWGYFSQRFQPAVLVRDDKQSTEAVELFNANQNAKNNAEVGKDSLHTCKDVF